jgi:hypothetical protein
MKFVLLWTSSLYPMNFVIIINILTLNIAIDEHKISCSAMPIKGFNLMLKKHFFCVLKHHIVCYG